MPLPNALKRILTSLPVKKTAIKHPLIQNKPLAFVPFKENSLDNTHAGIIRISILPVAT